MSEGQADRDLVDADEARQMVAQDDVRVIDIRDPDAFADYRIAGSENRPEPDAESLGEELADGGRLLIVCAEGKRSAELAGRLRERDVDAISLDGGVEAWRDAGHPMQPSPDVTEGEREPPKLPGAGV